MARSPTYRDVILGTPGLIGAWSLNQQGLVAFDLSGRGNNGPATGVPTTGQSGIVAGDTAVTFLGGTTNYSIPHMGLVVPTAEVSVELWIYPTATGGAAFGMPSAPGNQRCGAHLPWTDNNIYWDFGSNGGAGRLSYTPASLLNAWHHFVFTSSVARSSQQIWRNGVQEASSATPVTRVAVDEVWDMGDGQGVTSCSAKLQWIAVYSRPLLPAEIVAHYNARTLAPTRKRQSVQLPGSQFFITGSSAGLGGSLGTIGLTDPPVTGTGAGVAGSTGTLASQLAITAVSAALGGYSSALTAAETLTGISAGVGGGTGAVSGTGLSGAVTQYLAAALVTRDLKAAVTTRNLAVTIVTRSLNVNIRTRG